MLPQPPPEQGKRGHPGFMSQAACMGCWAYCQCSTDPRTGWSQTGTGRRGSLYADKGIAG